MKFKLYYPFLLGLIGLSIYVIYIKILKMFNYPDEG